MGRSKWGLLPPDVDSLLLEKEWLNPTNLKSRLLGKRPFPIKVNLKAPDGRMAVDDLQYFQKFIAAWKTCPNQNFVEWETKSYRTLGDQLIPRYFILHSIQDLIIAIGNNAEKRSNAWRLKMAPLLELPGNDIYPVLVKHLNTIENIPYKECLLLKNLIEQLSPDMGAGDYLRALPLVGVDTKFLENYRPLIADILDAIHGGEVTRKGGLSDWLGCLENPKGWICIRPLCTDAESKMGGFPILQLSIDVLSNCELPATNILVVENMQSGLGLPKLDDTIAVFGGGKNVAWMSADWLKNKQVAYWGDIDTWGLSILSDVREKLPSVRPLMMNVDTIENFQERMVIEPEPVDSCPPKLNDAEREMFYGLKSGRFESSRLEQERLSPDYIHLKLSEWLSQQN